MKTVLVIDCITNLIEFQPQHIVQLLDGSYVDGVIYCRFQRSARSTVLGNNFDLINNKYHLLLATGSSLKGLCH